MTPRRRRSESAVEGATGDRPGGIAGDDGRGDKASARFLADVATAVWRAQRAVAGAEADGAADVRRIGRHVEAAADALAAGGIEIQDHLDEPFDSGLSLKVVAFQPMAGVDRELIIETIRPGVYFRGRPIQMGEVVVGTPEGSEAGAHAPSEGQSPRDDTSEEEKGQTS